MKIECKHLNVRLYGQHLLLSLLLQSAGNFDSDDVITLACLDEMRFSANLLTAARCGLKIGKLRPSEKGCTALRMQNVERLN